MSDATNPADPATSTQDGGASPDRFGGRPLRWGLLGAGGIAATLAEAIGASPGNTVHAVAARDGARAGDLASRFGAERSFEGYDALVQDEDVDVVYVSTTHPWHLEQAMLAIAAGKPVLVEKPLTLNADQAHELFRAAHDAGVFAMEAMWMRCNPMVRRAIEIARSGQLGQVVHADARLCTHFDFDPTHRLFDPDNGGGALLDLGVYPATFVWLFLGAPATVQVTGALAPSGVDGSVGLQLGYAGGASAQVFCSSAAPGPGLGTVLGTDGWLQIGPPYQDPTEVVVEIDGHREVITAQRSGYVPQVQEVERCLRAGLLESPLVPHADTIGILQVLDAARRELGVSYPQESRP